MKIDEGTSVIPLYFCISLIIANTKLHISRFNGDKFSKAHFQDFTPP